MKHIKTPFNKTCLQSLFKKLQWKTVHIEPGDYYRVPFNTFSVNYVTIPFKTWKIFLSYIS